MSKYAKLLEWRKNNAIAISKAISEVSGDDLSILLENRGFVFSELYANHVTTELQVENAQLRARVAELEAENQKLGAVTNVAAVCMIDLNCNLKEAYKEYMAGDIPHGAYNHVLDRHGSLLAALAEAGYTEKHRIYEFPIKPQPAKAGAA